MSVSFTSLAFKDGLCITLILDMVGLSTPVTEYRGLAHVAVVALQAIIAFYLILILQTLFVCMTFLATSIASKGFPVC